MVETLSDGAVLSFGLESADPSVHEANWLNCDPGQLKSAIQLINKYGKERGARGLPKLLPGLNFIAGLNGESRESYSMNMDLLTDLRSEGLLLRRINIRQVEGEGFQEIPHDTFHEFKAQVRETIDRPLLKELFPLGQRLSEVHWETHDGRTRLPIHQTSTHTDESVHGNPGLTFGRQIGAYPILIGVPYHIPLDTSSDILVTGHGARSITGVEIGLDIQNASQKQFEAIPGIGKKTAWNLISTRAKLLRKQDDVSLEELFKAANTELTEAIKDVLCYSEPQ